MIRCTMHLTMSAPIECATRKIRGAPVLPRTSLTSLNKSAAADSSENFWGLLPNMDADTS